MQWFLALVDRLAVALAAWLGPLVLASAICCFVGALWALMQVGNPRSMWFQRKWAPPVMLAIAFALFGFRNLFDLTGATLGLTGGGGYRSLDAATLGDMPIPQVLVAVLGAFWQFFLVVGACICWKSILTLYDAMKNTTRHGKKKALVLWIAGSLIARLDLVAAALVSLRPGQG